MFVAVFFTTVSSDFEQSLVRKGYTITVYRKERKKGGREERRKERRRKGRREGTKHCCSWGTFPRRTERRGMRGRTEQVTGEAGGRQGSNTETLAICQQAQRLRWPCLRNKSTGALSAPPLPSGRLRPTPRRPSFSVGHLCSPTFSDSPSRTPCTALNLVGTSTAVPMVLPCSYVWAPLLGSKLQEQGLCHLYFPFMAAEHCVGARKGSL